MKESYENGVFRIGLAMDKVQNKPYNVPIITKEFFESKRYAKVEQFKFDQSVNRTHYSYFDFLSKPMVRTITRSSNDRTVFTQLENNATPVGGMQAFYQSIAQNIIYPAEARRNGTEGSVYVKFIVEKDGRITNVEVLKGIGDGCDEEAIEAVKMSPPWNPGLLDGVPQRQGIVVPVVFRLGETAKPKPNLSPR
ncbi:MAG: energy transducer TonB [Cyclobacteriaceae bacterium]